ncbi:MAG TPA: hypothetical protein VJ919_13115, partial [Tangfeifania sp.]|nr:hypothetical protein [Tangfeifania sp.]
MKAVKTNILLLFLIIFYANAEADVKLPKIFSSNMVLQQGIEIPVWGRAAQGEEINVTFNGETVRAVANEDGKWMVKIPSQKYGGPFTLTVNGENEIVFENVMVGEVWIASGQSNMQWSVAQSKNAKTEIAAANYPNIRLFSVPRKVAQFPQDDIESGEWLECSPETVPGFSAVAYFFGREINDKLDVPVGLIHSSWGGTVAETWISPETIAEDPDFREKMVELQQLNLDNYREQKLEQIRKMLGGELPDGEVDSINGKPAWSAVNYNDGDWKTISTPKYWEAQGYMDIDGVAWYRKEIELSENQTQDDLTLHLGKIDDEDITFING